MDIVKQWIFFPIDFVIYWVTGQIYKLFNTVSSATLLNNATINEFTGRIYAMIGIFMLFKVTMSLITLFAEPEKLNDAKIGGAAIVKRIVISMLLIVTVPTIFSLAFELQGAILRNNVIGKVVFGQTATTVDINDETIGDQIAVKLFSSFVQTKDGTDPLDTIPGYKTAVEKNDLWAFKDIVVDKNANYLIVISTVAGGFALWIMLMFCIEIAVRSVKLAFLQLIAPVPILNYIDLKKGSDMLNKWVKTSLTTYADVFIRLIAIYLGVYILTLLFRNGFQLYDVTKPMINGEYQKLGASSNLFLQALLIIGVLLFVKDMPKMLSDILGFKLDGGGFSLNPAKRLGQMPGVGKYAAAGLGMAGAAGSNAARIARRAAASKIKSAINNSKAGQKVNAATKNIRDKAKSMWDSDKMATDPTLRQLKGDVTKASREMADRWASLAAGEEKYSGDTLKGTLLKERKDAIRAKYAMEDKIAQYELGKELYNTEFEIKDEKGQPIKVSLKQAKDRKMGTEVEKAILSKIYSSPDFVNSLMNVDAAQGELTKKQTEVTLAHEALRRDPAAVQYYDARQSLTNAKDNVKTKQTNLDEAKKELALDPKNANKVAAVEKAQNELNDASKLVETKEIELDTLKVASPTSEAVVDRVEKAEVEYKRGESKLKRANEIHDLNRTIYINDAQAETALKMAKDASPTASGNTSSGTSGGSTSGGTSSGGTSSGSTSGATSSNNTSGGTTGTSSGGNTPSGASGTTTSPIPDEEVRVAMFTALRNMISSDVDDFFIDKALRESRRLTGSYNLEVAIDYLKKDGRI